MGVEERIELIRRNTAELVTEDEIKRLLAEKPRPIAYCGYEPSGEVHLGHLVTVTKLADLEKAGFKVKVLFADWHAWLNRKGSWDQIGEWVSLWEKSFKRLGLKMPEFVRGTEFQRSAAYINDVMTLALGTTVNRAVRAMQEVARDIETARVSQIIYPLMQVADMKHLSVDVAQAGIDQRKIHMLARETLGEIGYKKPAFVHTPIIESLSAPSGKMSSAVPESLISVRDSPAEIESKIGKAYCPEGAVEANPVLQIAQLIVMPRIDVLRISRPEKFGGSAEFRSYAELEKAFAAKKLHPADLKKAVASELSRILEPVRGVFA